MTVRASVIIPTWNGARFLGPCLTSLVAQTVREFEVLVVDNGSTDDTATLVATFATVRYIRLPRNRGFAVAANVGLRQGVGDILVLLNNDTEVEPNWLAALLNALDAAPEAGMAQSKVRLFERRDVLHTTGDTVNLAGWPANRGVWERDAGQWDAHRDVFGPNGAAAAYRRSLLDDVGLLEEAFGSYLEDVDLAWRARLRGWRCIFVPEAVVYHHVSATGGGAMASYLVARNRCWLVARCYPSALLWRHFGAVLGAQCSVALDAARHWRGAAARATLRGVLVGALTWPRMLPTRRVIQRRRKVDDATLEAWLTARSSP